MTIAIASDHGGYDKLNTLKQHLIKNNYEVIDYGTHNEDPVDYPDYAFKVGETISNKKADLGILICKTGIGMSIACNKVKGIRCAKVSTIEETKKAKEHNNANVIAVSANLDNNELIQITETFINTKFQQEIRHINRINKITEYENNHVK